MNEFQVAIGETTFGGRSEFQLRTGHNGLWEFDLCYITRAKTAREAIDKMSKWVEEYGYYSQENRFDCRSERSLDYGNDW